MSEEGVLEEAEFYNVTRLISILKEKIDQQKVVSKDFQNSLEPATRSIISCFICGLVVQTERNVLVLE